MNEETDELYRCGKAYEDMAETYEISYKIKFFAENSFKIQYEKNRTWQEIPVQKNTSHEINIIFTPGEFYHLSGLHKLQDMKMKPETAYKKVLGRPETGRPFTFEMVSRSQYFFDDIDTSNNEGKEIKEPSVAKSDFLGRLSALEHLSQTIAHSDISRTLNEARPLELKIYPWDRKASYSERPHNSDIKANFLIEIYDRNNSEKPFTDFFIVREEDGTYRGMSVFPSKVSYACYDNGRKITEMPALSLETFVKGKTVSLISADENVIENCRQRESQRNESIARERNNNPNKELKKAFMIELTKVRKDVIKSERTLSKKECRKHYCNFVELAETRLNQKPVDLFNTFSVEDIKSIVKDLESNSDSSKEKYISYEINALKSVINLKTMVNELEHLLQQEDFSADAYVKKLDEVSAYLCSHDAGRNLMLKVAELIERQKENCNDDLTAGYIDCTVQEIRETAEQKPEKSFGQSGSAYGQASAKPGSNMMQFRFDNPLSDVQADNTLALSAADMFRNALRSLAERFEMFMQNIAVKIQETFTMAFSKPYSDVSEKPEQKSAPEPDTQENLSESEMKSEPAEPAPETEIADDEYIIRDVYSIFADDSIGMQGYESYVMIIPADKLDFQIPFTYETEPQTEIQQTEQDMTEEKAVPSEFRKKQVEYGDF